MNNFFNNLKQKYFGKQKKILIAIITIEYEYVINSAVMGNYKSL